MRLLSAVRRELREALESRKGRVLQMTFFIFLFNLYSLSRRDYDERFGRPSAPGKRQSAVESARPAAGQTSSVWQWRDLPRLPRVLFLARLASTVYMVYVLVKYLLPQQAESLLESLHLAKPAHCYLLGRFKLHPRVDAIVASFFASYHLSWRLLTFVAFKDRRFIISTWYFMMLDERDIRLYAQLTDRKMHLHLGTALSYPGGSAEPLPAPQLESLKALHGSDPRMQFMDHTMGLRVESLAGAVYRQRPNRTLEAHRRLRAHLTSVTFWSIVVTVPIVAIVTLCLLAKNVNYQRLRRDYRNCDAALERLEREQPALHEWLLHLSAYQMAALGFDMLENSILWLESGLICMSFLSYTIIMNYDLLLYWRHLDWKLDSLVEIAKDAVHHELERCANPLVSRLEAAEHEREWDHSVSELQLELRDFVKRVHESDIFMTDAASYIVTVWFTLFATLTYATLRRGMVRISVELMLVLLFVFVITSCVWCILLSLHRRCLRSYPKLCSLMAMDRSKWRTYFGELLDYFVRPQICYTVYRTRPITTTTYLTIIGYSFTCYFLISSARNR